MNRPLFPGLTDPDVLENHVAGIMRKASIDPAFVHAFRVTGLLVSVHNEHLIDDEDLDAWFAAVADYRSTEEHASRTRMELWAGGYRPNLAVDMIVRAKTKLNEP